MIQTKALLPGVTLRCFRDSRFKQGCLSFQLVRQMRREEAAMNALIPAVLLRGTRRCPDLRAITLALDELYGAAVSPLVRRVGDYQTLGLYCSFLDDRFALEGDRVLGPTVDFLRELLLDSPLVEEGFDPGFVESEKKNLIATIESQLNDKRAYAMGRLLERMCGADSFGLPRLGRVADVAAIEPRALYRHYRQVLTESPIQIFYAGSADADTLAGLLMPLLSRLDRAPRSLPPQTALQAPEPSDTAEVLDVTQGKLCMGFTTSITNRSPEFPALQVFNTVFGAGMTSKLFMQVRERLSLCYSIGSGCYGTKGIVTVAAGIDFDREDQVRREILAQLDACRACQITPEELHCAQEAIRSSLRATHDSPGAIEGYYATGALSGMDLTPQAYIRALEAVTAEDVARVAGTLRLHTVYFLKGADQ